MNDSYADINARVIDGWVEKGWQWGKPIDHETFARTQDGDWSVLLTPLKPVPREWFCPFDGAVILGLACGGAQQIPIFAALGAECTVLDYSDRQLESELMVARREGYAVRTVKHDMSKPLPFADAAFDLIFHPVSNCYIREILPLWQECYRVLKPGGILLAGFDVGFNYLFEDDETVMVNVLPYDPLADRDRYARALAGDSGIQFSHTIEEQIGGQLAAGFTLAGIYQDTNASGHLHELNVPTFYATRAVKKT